MSQNSVVLPQEEIPNVGVFLGVNHPSLDFFLGFRSLFVKNILVSEIIEPLMVKV